MGPQQVPVSQLGLQQLQAVPPWPLAAPPWAAAPTPGIPDGLGMGEVPTAPETSWEALFNFLGPEGFAAAATGIGPGAGMNQGTAPAMGGGANVGGGFMASAI